MRSSTGSKEEDDRFNQKENDVADIINSKDRGLQAQLHLELFLLCWDAWPSPASTVKKSILGGGRVRDAALPSQDRGICSLLCLQHHLLAGSDRLDCEVIWIWLVVVCSTDALRCLSRGAGGNHEAPDRFGRPCHLHSHES